MAPVKTKNRSSLQKKAVKWLSDTINQIDVPRKSEKCYSKFEFRSVVASVGDFVLVLNADAVEPDTVDGSDVARILQLYESETNKEDPYRAVVQWYSRVRELPKKAVTQFDSFPALHHEHEVVEETRQFDNDISIETIFRNCRVVFAPPSKDPQEAVRETTGSTAPLFVCRFRLVCRSRTNATLEPVFETAELGCSNGILKRSRRKIFPGSDDLLYDSVTSPGRQKLKTPERTQDLETDVSDSDANQFIKMTSSKIKQKYKQHSLSSSKNGSGHRNSKGPEDVNGTHKLISLQSSDRMRKIRNGHSDSDSDEETRLKPEILLSNEASGKKSTSKNCKQERSTPSGSAPGCRSVKRSASAKKVRRRLHEELEDITRSCVLKGESSDSDSDDVIKQSTPTRKRDKTASMDHTPSMPRRKCSVSTPTTVLEEARSRLHVSAVPQELPCRETEFHSVYHFVRSKVLDNVGGCMYISGVPGTGKTATVHEVLNCLRSEVDANDLPHFKLVKINGMQLIEPRQAYVEILHQLTGQKMKSQQAQQILEKRFKTPAPRRTTTVVVVDELDLLCTRRQDVIYNLLDWPNYSTAHLVVITIANTMDLPERSFINRVNSRMGLTRITFQPYTHMQLQKIVMSRLEGLNAFNPDAVQLIARKVAAVSGDARRALDMCRRAAEISSSSEMVTMDHVNQVLQEMITSPKIQAIRCCSVLEQAFLKAIAAEVCRTGVEETVFSSVYQQLYTLCLIDNLTKPSISQAFGLCARLGACRLLLTEHSRASTYQRIILNVSTDDIHYATSQHI